jgi:hypothetical protein
MIRVTTDWATWAHYRHLSHVVITACVSHIVGGALPPVVGWNGLSPFGSLPPIVQADQPPLSGNAWAPPLGLNGGASIIVFPPSGFGNGFDEGNDKEKDSLVNAIALDNSPPDIILASNNTPSGSSNDTPNGGNTKVVTNLPEPPSVMLFLSFCVGLLWLRRTRNE